MPNANNLGDDMQVDMPQTKRARITSQSNGVVENTETDWLNVVLNKQEVDPSCEPWDCYFQDSQVPKHKAPNSDITFATPFVFKPVNPAQGFPTGDSPNAFKRQESLFTSNYPSFSASTLSEDQVGKIVEILGAVLEEIKVDIWRTVLNPNRDHIIPPSFIREFNKLVNESSYTQPTNIKPPLIKTVEHLRSIFSPSNTSITLSSDAELYSHREEGPHTRRLSIEKFMNIFDDADNFLLYHSSPIEIEPNNSDLEAFFWYYRGIIRPQPQYHCDLSDRFRKLSIYFSSLDITESILSMFYTKHFLNVFAKEHQKDHGQFYTPREVMRFMWDRVLLGRGNGTWIEKLLGGSFQSKNVMSYQIGQSSIASPPWSIYPQAPKVLDPCMGIGSFLCEFIHRITLAAQQCPSVWHDPKAISHLLQSLTKNIWGIEIDAFAFHLCKLNITIHMLPLYKRFIQLSYASEIKLPRLHLFCNDTLNLYLPKRELTWEYDNLWLLRSPQRLKFDYIVTNPPYMIRKTGFISEPDSELFDERVLGKGGMQAYAYFFWFCVERCQEEAGEICLISAWLWQKCHLVEFFQFEPFKVWRKIQTDSLIFRLRRRRESLSPNSLIPIRPPITSEPPTIFLRYMNRKATLQETLQAYADFNPNNTPFDKDMHCKITPPYPHTILPSPTSSYSFTFLMPTSAVSAYLHSITAHLPSLCDHSSMKPTWLECNPLIWHRGPNTNPVYALVVRTSWAYSKFGKEVCRRWLRPVFYWNGKNGGKEAEFWQKMGDELRLEKKESSPAEAYVPFLSYNSGGSTISKDGLEQEKSMYSLIMVDRDAVDKVRKDFGESSEFWIYLKEARKYLQTGMTSREVAYCGTSKCGIDIRTKIIHPINYGYFSKNQPRQRFFIDEDNVCVTNQCIYFTIKSTTGLPPHFFLGLLNSTTIQHFLSHHCKYDQQGRMRLFRENMAKIPYAAPTNPDGIDWFIKCTQRMIRVRQMLYEGIGSCEDEEKVGGAVVEKLRRGTWQLTGREWQEKESDGCNNETSVILREEQEGNWVMVKQCRGRGENLEYSLCPGFEDEQGAGQSSKLYNRYSSSAGMSVMNEHRATKGNTTRTHFLKPFFESLLHASACLQYGIDQYAYSLYGIDAKFQIALEEELKIENFEIIITKFPRWNGNIRNGPGETETRGVVPEWGERLLVEVDQAIKGGECLLRQKRMPVGNRN
ncbi:21362_t:CDS:2 [Dentiscutata erythropus]|uniref:site-specific DNA-methyltransferase (adenine-specific) n=1 Tax=Dentiscutata erythropus TaxID=1348616 RepID=A0A9N9FA13_9GLOM|nr:21362_t:CDS:2 [Dentiscutata erythropus]